MDDEKKMTLGAEEEKQFHSRFPFSLSRPATSHFYLVLSPLYFFLFFRPTLVAHGARLRSDTSGERGRETRPARDPHEVVMIVIYISFLFISMTTSPRLQQ